MRLFSPRSRRNIRVAGGTSLTLPLVGTSYQTTTPDSDWQEEAPKSSDKIGRKKKKTPRFAFGPSKVSTPDGIGPGCQRKKKDHGSRTARDLFQLVEDKRKHLSARYQQLQQQLDVLLEQGNKTELRAVRQKMVECDQELAENKEQYQLMIFRYNANSQNLQSLSLTSVPPVDKSLKDDENNAVKQVGKASVGIPCQQKVANYTLQDSVGQGGHGTVWKATTRNSSHAIKIISKASLDRWYKVQLLENEIRALKSLSHENILSLQNVLHGPANIYIVTELAWTDAHALAVCQQRSARTTKWLSTVREIAVGVLRALQYLHNAGCAHLDVKPENILLVGDGNDITSKQVRLCDFGYYRDVTGSVEGYGEEKKCEDAALNLSTEPSQAVVGTLGFIAPEIICMQSSSTSAADMWSLGATLLDLLVGLPDDWMDCYEQASREHLDHCGDLLSENLRNCFLTIQQQHLGDELMDWIASDLLAPSPQQRLSATESLHQMFWMHTAKDEELDSRDFC